MTSPLLPGPALTQTCINKGPKPAGTARLTAGLLGEAELVVGVAAVVGVVPTVLFTWSVVGAAPLFVPAAPASPGVEAAFPAEFACPPEVAGGASVLGRLWCALVAVDDLAAVRGPTEELLAGWWEAAAFFA